MTNLIALTVFIALVLGVVAALQHNHRRMAGYGQVPFGFDRERINDRDGARATGDLAAIAAYRADSGTETVGSGTFHGESVGTGRPVSPSEPRR